MFILYLQKAAVLFAINYLSILSPMYNI